jgi:serine/threonine-protein kinase
MSAELPSTGIEIFGYVIEKRLGKGGMGTVYLAKQKSLDRLVAIKLMHSNRLKTPGAVESFLREARNAAKLNHPNLAAVHDVHADESLGLYCYSMEYVEGVTAGKLVQTHGPLKRSQALHIIFQVAKALGHAHRNDIVHRDVKPDNILVTTSGTAKLLDLGLVRDRIENQGDQQRVLSIVGTPDFSAPEQHRNPKTAVAASDVYSLGATLYYLLTGRPPFAGDTIIDLIVRAATEPIAYPALVPADCRRLLDLMLGKRPSERFYDGDAVVEALKNLAAGRMPTLHPNGVADGTTTSIGSDEDEGFEESETEGELQVGELPAQEGDAAMSSRRRAIQRRRRRR